MNSRSEISQPLRSQLRKELRSQRRALSPSMRRHYSAAMAKIIATTHLFKCSRRIAFYLASDGEIDPLPLLRLAWARRKLCYLPVLAGRRYAQGLRFAPYRQGDPLVYNRFGIAEPDLPVAQRVSPRRLDLVLTPLVAFDLSGNRLGMGGGFYDRSFAFLKLRRCWQRPSLLGIAYDFQQVASIQAQAWDVPLRGVVTDRQAYFFDPNTG